MFLEHQISILEYFLKKHVTLKTEAAKNVACHPRNKYKNTLNRNITYISKSLPILLYFLLIESSIGEHKRRLSKTFQQSSCELFCFMYLISQQHSIALIMNWLTLDPVVRFTSCTD